MNVISARNVQQALPTALKMLSAVGRTRDSRNGRVTVAPTPVSTVYHRPCERVVFWPERDANPFFHFYESLWMLAGRDDLAALTPFVGSFGKFSGDQKTLHGAYGYRWRVGMPGTKRWQEDVDGSRHPLIQDQLVTIGQLLRANRDDRRCVLQMWDAWSDLGSKNPDVPCNDTATFQIDDTGALNMVVFCRSNDIVLGCYGANAVHFSALLEYMAARCEARVGTYTQVSVNWHGYDETFLPLRDALSKKLLTCDPYEDEVSPYPMVSVAPHLWDADLRIFMHETVPGKYPADRMYEDPFFHDVATPIVRAHARYKTTEGPARYAMAQEELGRCVATDWRKACSEWVERRHQKYLRSLA